MDCNSSGEDGLIEDNVNLEDDSINFWATIDVSPHVAEPDQHPPLHHQHLEHQSAPPPHMEMVESSIRRDLFETEETQLEPFVGMEFESGEAAKTFYIAYAGHVGFCVRIARSRRSKCNEDVIMLRFVCSREGWSREKRIIEGKKTRKRAASIREGCKAMLEVIRKGDGRWVVTKLLKEHNHEVGMPSRVHYIATEGDAELEPFLGMEFESLEIARTFYYAYASRLGFEARVRQSRRSLHDETLKMLKLVCSKHRYHSGRDNHEDGRSAQCNETIKEKDGCEALFEIIRKDGDRWVVSKLMLEHSHPLISAPLSKVRCVRSQGEILVIAKNFADTRNLLLNGQESQYPRDVRYNDLGPEDAQNLFEYFRKIQSENLAFYYLVQVEHNNFTTNILWADAKARMAYNYFGDVVTFDTSYLHDKDMMPIVTFSGVNHHMQPVVFGCALIVDQTETSFAWLFENWLVAMGGNPPVSLITNLDVAIAAAAAKVFPNTRHRFCKKCILNRFQVEFTDVYLSNTTFDGELRSCIDGSETSEAFESCWELIIDKYNLRDNEYLQSLYSIRQHWVPLYFKDSFFAEISISPPPEGIDKIVEKHFTAKTSLRVAVRQFGMAIANRFEKEALADFNTIHNKPFLRTAGPMEKQAASIYTRTVFEKFQEEFIQSLGYHVNKMEDGAISRYCVARNEDAHETYIVTFKASENKAKCSCCMFEFTGILCRHAIRVFIISGIRVLPKNYILKRWTKNAKSNVVSDECGVELRGNNEEPSDVRYNDLCRDAMKCAREGSASAEFYRIAKDALQKAVHEVVSAKQKKGQLTLQNFIKSQKTKKFTRSSKKKDDVKKCERKKSSRVIPSSVKDSI
ncbi:FAR1-related sequence 5 [Zostera marina]|uniref:Protein FAR1-RELATED SEQUENCE n=1 Tax=Zostera marina TaxID=29655 RepID=A0A0K9NZ90_ZOSMR|nr:FAR1-related sequence 5 [Zostera marina]